jgi:hypothetical protein
VAQPDEPSRDEDACTACGHTRGIRIALQGAQAARLWRLLGEQLTEDEKASG